MKIAVETLNEASTCDDKCACTSVPTWDLGTVVERRQPRSRLLEGGAVISCPRCLYRWSCPPRRLDPLPTPVIPRHTVADKVTLRIHQPMTSSDV